MLSLEVFSHSSPKEVSKKKVTFVAFVSRLTSRNQDDPMLVNILWESPSFVLFKEYMA